MDQHQELVAVAQEARLHCLEAVRRPGLVVRLLWRAGAAQVARVERFRCRQQLVERLALVAM